MRKMFSTIVAMAAMTVMLGAPSATADEAASYFQWRNADSALCMGVSGGHMVNGTKIIQWTCSATNPDQRWTALPLSESDHGYYLMRNKKDPSKCLAVPNRSGSPGVQLIIWSCNAANPDQLWNVSYIDYLGYGIYNKYSQLTIGVSGGSSANGAPVIQWYPSGALDQTWQYRN